jgi:hypothetical protein
VAIQLGQDSYGHALGDEVDQEIEAVLAHAGSLGGAQR